MKKIHLLGILLIGMISLTAFSSTSEPEQKPTTTFSGDHSFEFATTVVNVDYDFKVLALSADSFTITNAQLSAIAPTCNYQPLATTVMDVGWRIYNQDVANYTKKLNGKNHLNHNLIKSYCGSNY